MTVYIIVYGSSNKLVPRADDSLLAKGQLLLIVLHYYCEQFPVDLCRGPS